VKTYISKGTGIGKESTKVKIDPKTGKVQTGQFNENKILLVKEQKYWTREEHKIYAVVFFIFNFPQRKINKALKENK
jgi:hypothetical protein